MRRTASIAIACAASVIMPAAAIAPATPASAADTPAFGLVVPVLAPMLPGQTGWVSTMWAAADDVCDVRVTASGTGVTVSYPENTGTYSSLAKGASLDKGHMDYAAFNVSLSTKNLIALVPLKLTYSYTVENNGADHSGNCTGKKHTETTTATLPVVMVTGDAVVQKTTSVTVPRKTPVWSQLVLQARRSGVDDLRVTVDGGPAGLVVSYPADRAYTSPNAAAGLPVGTDDFVAVRFDATGVAAGTYTLTVRQSYGSTTDTNDLTLVVT